MAGTALVCTTVFAEVKGIETAQTRDYWIMHLKLDVPELDPQVVQYALFDHDPIPDFKVRVKNYSRFYYQMIDRVKTEEEKQNLCRAGLRYRWDEAFEDISGDKVYLLKGKGSASSNTPGKQWVVTKITYLDDTPICWCIPIELRIGEEVIVNLNKKNLFNLSEVFDESLVDYQKPEKTLYPTDPDFKDETKAHALYDKMVETMQDARTLYYESIYWIGREGEEPVKSTYRIWMKKPNYVRIEASRKDRVAGTLVGDGEYFWIYWGAKDVDFDGESFESYSNTTYMKIPSPEGHHSIAHMTVRLGAGMGMTILQPSRFHGGGSGLDEYIDGVRSIGSEMVNGEICDIIEVSIMNNQRSQYLWLTRNDHLPRKLMEIVRVSDTRITKELWSNVFTNVDIPDALFSWQPPAGWEEYQDPELDENLLKPGTIAPDFEFKTLDGDALKLSKFQGSVVLINFWRVGCPPCRWEMPHLERLYRKYKRQGLIVLGFNSSDDHNIAVELLTTYSVTYPNVVNCSKEAQNVQYMLYNPGRSGSGVPMNYIVDREGRVADAWYGFDRRNEIFLDKKLEPFGFK
jgi:thiol-disulfide isomerase/thioredoxin/outer membrane lipoprotein-sorting protein